MWAKRKRDSAVCCFLAILAIYSRMCLRERIHLLNLAAPTTDVTHIGAGTKLQATSPNGSPRCLTKQRDWRDTIICSFERKYQGLADEVGSPWGFQGLLRVRAFLIASGGGDRSSAAAASHTDDGIGLECVASIWSHKIDLGISLTT